MAYWDRQTSNPFGFRITPWVKRLLIANFVIFLFTWPQISTWWNPLAFRPETIVTRPWTLVTYMFVHAGLFHVLLNMLFLFFFGPPLEERWGARGFIKYYMVAGVSGALLSVVGAVFGLMPWFVPIIGASGAVYGVMFAYAYYWPHNPVYIWGILPIKAWWLVAFLIGISVLLLLTGGGTGIAHLAHLGGVAGGYLLIRSRWGPSEWGGYGRPARSGGAGAATGGMLRTLQRAVRRANTERAQEDAGQRPPPPRSRREERELLDDVDRILDKISTSGLDSLSEEERQRLEQVSRKFRTK